jgi:hypothetical protein
MSYTIGDRLKWKWDARSPLFAGRKAKVTASRYWGLHVVFEDGQFPFDRCLFFERDWAADLEFYVGAEVVQEYSGQWRAVYHGDEEAGDRHGWGPNAEEALDALGEKLLERVDDRLYDLVNAGEVDEDVFHAFDKL